MEDGTYPDKTSWPFEQKESTIQHYAGALVRFIEYVGESIVVKNGAMFNLDELTDLDTLKSVMESYGKHLALEYEPKRSLTSGLKRKLNHPNVSDADKEVACRSLLPSSVQTMTNHALAAFQILAIVNPDGGGYEVLTANQVEGNTNISIAQRGSVQAFDTRPLLPVDLQHAFHRTPPNSMLSLGHCLIVLFQSYFGARTCALFPRNRSTKQIGLRLKHVKSISYNARLDAYRISVTFCYEKTSGNLLEEITEEIVTGEDVFDLSRLLVLFLGMRNVFEKRLPMAHVENDFRIRTACREEFLFGKGTGQFPMPGFVSDVVPTSDGMTTTAYKTVAQSLGVPESYVSSRSTRQGYGTSAVLGHISRNPATVWSECVKQAQQSLNWKTQSSVEHYLKAPGGELQACLKRVQLLVRRDPRLAQVDAFRYFTHLSQMRLLEGYRELDEDEQLAVQEEGECAYETRQTNAEKEGEVLRRLAENHEQEGRYPEARMARDQATKLTDAKAKASWKRMKAHATQSAKSILLSEIIDEAMGKMHSVPELPSLPSHTIDVVQTYISCERATVAMLECVRQQLVVPNAGLYPGAAVRCAISGCYETFSTKDCRALKAHLEAHFDSDGGGKCSACHEVGRQMNAMCSWKEWTDHYKASHLHQICFDCPDPQKFYPEEEELIGVHSAANPFHKLVPWDSLRICYRQWKPPCGCDKGRCAYETTAALRNLLSDDAAALKAIGPYLESPPRSRFGWVAKFVEIGLGHLRGQSTNGSLPENAKHCLEYHADELIPRL